MNPTPLSVVMPVHNEARFLQKAVESILSQTYRDFEFIIVDDHSTDSSLDVIRKYAETDSRIRILQNERNMGIAATVNRGIRASRGKYIARMDGDDVSQKERLATQIEFLKEHPDVGVVGTGVYLIDNQGRAFGKREYCEDNCEIKRRLFRFSPFAHPTVMIVKDTIVRAGLYDPSFGPADDYDLWFRIGRITEFANIKEPLHCYRIHTGGTTAKQFREMQQATLRVRLRACKEYGYKMNFTDRIYWIVGLLVPLFLPTKLSLKLFSLLRDKSI